MQVSGVRTNQNSKPAFGCCICREGRILKSNIKAIQSTEPGMNYVSPDAINAFIDNTAPYCTEKHDQGMAELKELDPREVINRAGEFLKNIYKKVDTSRLKEESFSPNRRTKHKLEWVS